MAEGFAWSAMGWGGVLLADGAVDGVGDAAEVATAIGWCRPVSRERWLPPDSAVQPASIRPAMINPPSPVRTVMT